MEPNGRVVDRDVEGLSGFGKRHTPYVDKIKDRRVVRTQLPGLRHAAIAGRNRLHRNRLGIEACRFHETLLAGTFARSIDHDIAVHAVKPGKNPIGIAQRVSFLNRAHGGDLKDVVNICRGNPGPHKTS